MHSVINDVIRNRSHNQVACCIHSLFKSCEFSLLESHSVVNGKVKLESCKCIGPCPLLLERDYHLAVLSNAKVADVLSPSVSQYIPKNAPVLQLQSRLVRACNFGTT